VAMGYTHVRRYQLGLPVWRAFSETVQTDMPGVLYIHGGDRTAVWVDARTRSEFLAASIPGAVNVQKGEAVVANDDGRLPLQDKGTRVVVFGTTAEQARVVAAEIAKRAYWNSSYFGGRFDDLAAAGLINHGPVVVARNAALDADAACVATVRAADLDNGSYDPDSGDLLTLAVTPGGPFGVGQHQVALVGTDRHGASASAAAFITVSDRTGPSIGEIVVQRQGDSSEGHGMRLFTVDYTTSDNCGGVTTELSVAGRDADDRAQVIDAHHVLLKGGLGGGHGDDDERRRFTLTILATDEAGNQTSRSVSIGGRAKEH